jgi:L-lactate dehydrogenase (cytochrome)
MTILNSIADLRAVAQRRVPRAIFEYADRGSYDELTLRRNRADLDALQLRQRVGVDVASIATATTMLGQDCALPLGIAPTGLTGLFHRDGEVCGALAAAAAGIPFCLSTVSIGSIEDVRAASTTPFWFQLYLMRDRGFNEDLIARARAAQCPVLVLTLDLPVLGLRRRDAKNGLSVPPRLTLRNALEIATKPTWALGMLRARRRTFGNLEGRLNAPGGLRSLSSWLNEQSYPAANWSDVAWVRAQWPGRLVIKGILDPEDARRAAEHGADAVVVSNHGGRQLDGSPSSISVLPRVAEAVQGRCEVLFDGGIQSGQDVLKALASGARGCLMGKAFLYALGARGQAGVTLAIDIMRRELEVSMALAGVTDVRAIDAGVLWRAERH